MAKIKIITQLQLLQWVKIKQRFWAITLIFLLMFSVAACNSQLLTSQANQVPQVVQAILSDPKTFNYVLSQESPNVFGLTYEGLITENPFTGKPQPALAKSWEISDDKLQIIFTLREGLKWSDGEPLTADDVIFSFNDLFLNEKIPFNGRDSLRIGQSQQFPTVVKLNDQQVKFTSPEPFAPFLSTVGGMAVLPAHALQKAVKTKDKAGQSIFLSTWGVNTPPEKIVVNGAYKLATYINGQRVIFIANPYYWKKDEQGNQLPYIQRIVWEIVESTDTALLQFRSGSLDSIGVAPQYFSLLKKEEERGKFTIYNGGPNYGTNFLALNLNKGKRKGEFLVKPFKSAWFNNVNFRRAIAHSIDRERIINNIYRGLGELQNSPISVQSPFYDKTLKGYDYDIEKAQKLLRQEGFKYNNQGELFDAKGNRVEFSLITNSGNEIREAMASQIQEDLKKIGIKLNLTFLDFNALVDKLDNALNWECYLLGFTGGNEPNDGANVWFPKGSLHSFNQYPQPGIPPIEGWEVSDWENQIADLYIEGARELDETKRKEIYSKTQHLTEEYLPFIYLVNPFSLAAVKNRIQGVEFSALGGAFWNIETLKIVDEVDE